MDRLQLIQLAKSKHAGVCYFLLTGCDVSASIQEALDNGLITKYFENRLI